MVDNSSHTSPKMVYDGNYLNNTNDPTYHPGMFSVSIPLLLLHTQVLIKGLVRFISFNSILLILTEGMSFQLVTLFITYGVRIVPHLGTRKSWELTRPDSPLEK